MQMVLNRRIRCTFSACVSREERYDCSAPQPRNGRDQSLDMTWNVKAVNCHDYDSVTGQATRVNDVLLACSHERAMELMDF